MNVGIFMALALSLALALALDCLYRFNKTKSVHILI
jgi:hypothetical protein